jgi:hypothetical protein
VELTAQGPFVRERLEPVPCRDVAVFDVLKEFAEMRYRIPDLGDQRLAFLMRVPQLFVEDARRNLRQSTLKDTDWSERRRQKRLMRSVVQVREQERLCEQREFDHAADYVLSKTVSDSQTKALLTKQLKRDRLQL